MINDFNLDDLIKAHRDYMAQEESSYKSYEAYVSACKKAPGPGITDVSDTSVNPLFGWVHSWDPDSTVDLKKFQDWYTEDTSRLWFLQNEILATAEISKLQKQLSDTFDAIALFCREKSFAPTAVSMILHAFAPKLLLTWNINIRAKVLPGIKQYDGDVYADKFLPKMQAALRSALDKDELVATPAPMDYEVMNRLASMMIADSGIDVPLAQLLDEFNYLRYMR